MRKLLFSLSAVLVLSLANVPAAHADRYVYSFSGGLTGSFVVDPSTPPSSYEQNSYFGDDISGQTGSFINLSPAYFINPAGIYAGDLQVGGYLIAGPQLYSGSESSPTYLTGTFHLTDFQSHFGPTTLNVVLTPEPSGMVLLGTGILGLAGVLRRRFVA